jgi:hypothetical protein
MLTGPGREEHTAELADALNTSLAREEKEDDIEITVPLITDIPDDTDEIPEDAPRINVIQDIEPSPVATSSHDVPSLIEEVQTLMQPTIHLKRMEIDVGPPSNLIVCDDIDVKKEELEDAKRVSFTPDEDSFLKDGIKKYGNSKTKWADILKDEEYKFHPTRTRDTLRVRSTSLKNGKRRSRNSKKTPGNVVNV